MDRLGATLIVACALHVSAIAAFTRIVRPAVAVPRAEDATIEVALAPESEPEPEHDAPEAPVARIDARELAKKAIAGSSRGGPHATEGSPDAVPASEPTAAPAGSSGEPWSFAPARPEIDLGTTGRYGTPEAPGERVGPAASAAPKWSGAADERDVALGMTRGGAAVAVARDLTREGSTPIDGYAIFDATADASGTVTDVRVIDVSSDRPSWEEVARRMVPALASKRFSVPPGARGLVVRIRVESKWQYPNGRSASGKQPSAAVRTALLPLTVVLGQDPTEREKPLRAVIARVLEERPL
jgi:hypothetical protein